MTYQNIEEMSTDEIGEEYAELILIVDYGVNKWNEPVDRPVFVGQRIAALDTAYRQRPDAESLAAFLECAFEIAEENGLEVKEQ